MNKLNEFFENSKYIYLTIFICLLVAHLPSITNDFLRQDDWNATFWSRGGFFFLPWGHPEWWNAFAELFRPVGAIILMISDGISVKIENAKFVKFFTVILMSVSAFLTFKWIIKFDPSKKIFALSFSILAFCLFASQLHSSTVGYNGMVITLICGQLGIMYFYKAIFESKKYIEKKRLLFISGMFILLGCLNYPLTVTYYFLLLFIYYILSIEKLKSESKKIYIFIFQAVVFMLTMMLIFFISAKLFHILLDIQPRMHGGHLRTIHVDLDIKNKIYNLINMIKYSTNIFNLWSSAGISNISYFYSVFFSFFSLFVLSIFLKFYSICDHKGVKILKYLLLNTFIVISITGILLTLTYLPVLPLQVRIVDDNPFLTIMTNRYFAITMPFIMFIMMWSLSNFQMIKFFLFKNNFLVNIVFIFILFFGIYQCNFSLKNYIVSPHMAELNHIKHFIEKDVIKKIQKGVKPKILIVRNPSIRGKYHNSDYDLSINFSHNFLVSAAIYTLRQYDVWTIKSHRVLTWDNTNGIHIISDWGTLASVSDRSTFDIYGQQDTIVIDMNDIKTKY